jgi:hypothetical protein
MDKNPVETHEHVFIMVVVGHLLPLHLQNITKKLIINLLSSFKRIFESFFSIYQNPHVTQHRWIKLSTKTMTKWNWNTKDVSITSPKVVFPTLGMQIK